MRIPSELLKCYDLGLCTDDALYFTDFMWQPKAKLNDAPYWDFIHPGVVQFAYSVRRDLWVLFDDWNLEEPLVVFYSLGSDCKVLANSFRHFLVRMTIEEFGGTWLVDDKADLDTVDAKFRSYPSKLVPIIGATLANELLELITHKKLRREAPGHGAGYLDPAETKAAIERLIGFQFLELEVQLDTLAPDYNGMQRPSK